MLENIDLFQVCLLVMWLYLFIVCLLVSLNVKQIGSVFSVA